MSLKARARAAGLNLAASGLVLAAAYFLLLARWYPAPYGRIQGVAGLFALLAGVQVVLGPGLTFLLYRPGKKVLWLDLTVVFLLQAGALAFALHALWLEQPRWMVFALDRFKLVAAREVDPAAIRNPRFLHKPERGPLPVIASLPLDPREYEQLMQETLFEGKPDIEYRPRYWSDYAQGFAAVAAGAKTLAELARLQPGCRPLVEQAARSRDTRPDSLLYLPVLGKRRDFAVVLDPAGGEIVDALPCDPWD